MRFFSTRGKDSVDTASLAIVQGLANDGGLFVPEKFPDVYSKIDDMLSMTYAERSCLVVGSFLDDYNKDKLLSACNNAYNKFTDSEPAPLVKVSDNKYVMELYHGPTLAFKDVALTLLPYLLREGSNINGVKEEILILVATSGDTGKAALEGFKDAEGIKIIVFYPSEGVSDMQKLQMATQSGNNVEVVAVEGNFDDCQTAVKKIFSDKNINLDLKNKGVILSSANSISFGRLVPQIAYYFSAYCDLINSEEIKKGDLVDFVVPTGNFGNILAGYYAKKMGLPIGKLVCASNNNNVLTEFFLTGDYDANREFYKTASPSMDILISSNLERLIYEISGRDSELTLKRMEDLKKTGKYSISDMEKTALKNEFYAGYCDEEECMDNISYYFDEVGYLFDPHTSVAIKVCDNYLEDTLSANKVVVLSTASPYKFSQSVLNAITGKNVKDPFKCATSLELETACPIPEQISELKTKERRFTKIINKNDTKKAVYDFLFGKQD